MNHDDDHDEIMMSCVMALSLCVCDWGNCWSWCTGKMAGEVKKTTVPEYTNVLLPKIVKLTIISLREESKFWRIINGLWDWAPSMRAGKKQVSRLQATLQKLFRI
jgi:hypothetical protein